MTELERLNMRVTAAWWAVLLAGCLAVMLWVASHKAIIISDISYGSESIAGAESASAAGKPMVLQKIQGLENCLELSLGKNFKAENVVAENGYMDRELRFFLKDAEADGYENGTVLGDISHVLGAVWEEQNDGVLIKLQMDGIYEYKTSMENDMLRVELYDPHDLYKMVVVIDPAGGGNEVGERYGNILEKNIALQVGKLVQKQWENADVRLYYTRTEDADVSDAQREALAEEVRADLYVRLAVRTDEDAQRYGICGRYNDLYFLPEFGNVQLADVLVRNVTIQGGNRAIGLQAAQEDSVLQSLRIPAAEIDLGFLSHERELELLMQEAYLEKLAAGIVNALGEVYGEYYE